MLLQGARASSFTPKDTTIAWDCNTLWKLIVVGIITRSFTSQPQNYISSRMDGVSFSDRAVGVFRACCLVPVATAAHIIPGHCGGEGVEVQVSWTQKDIERGKKITSSKSYFVKKVSEALQVACASTFQADVTDM